MGNISDKFEELAFICKELGWSISFLDDGNSGDVHGLVIGQKDYIENVLSELPDGADYSIYSFPYNQNN